MATPPSILFSLKWKACLIPWAVLTKYFLKLQYPLGNAKVICYNNILWQIKDYIGEKHTMNKKQIYENQRFGEERALYGERGVTVRNCSFDGEEDGESALKEACNILVEHTYCNLRYPFWHCTNLEIRNSKMTDKCRAALWYSNDILITDTEMHGTKALRECCDVRLSDCDILSQEFGWSTRGLTMTDCTAQGEYFLLRASDIVAHMLSMKGKYSFQYIENATLEDCVLDTKDAFWHAKNVTIKNCTLKGEYLAWYAENITFINCKISGTQPFCYCKGLRLIDCELNDADLCFERSEVEATLTAPVISIKNPYMGKISVPSVGELIKDDPMALATVTETEKTI